MRRVAIISVGGRHYEKGVLSGARDYAQERGWAFRLMRITHEMRPGELRGLRLNGLLVRGHLESVMSARSELPAVYIGFSAPEHLHSICGDEFISGQQAARHLIEQRVGRLLFFFRGDHPHSRVRYAGFRDEADRRGVPCDRFLSGARTQARGTWMLSDQLADLADLLRRLPKPIGLCAADDTHGERAVQACQLAGLTVPDDVAIICHSIDADFCELAEPSLSSVSPDSVSNGRAAAALLERLMDGEDVPVGAHRVPPAPVVVRDSSNFIAVSDPLVDQALRTIRSDIAELADVSDLVERLPTSRPTLERRFRKVLGRSPATEVRRARLHATKQMLRESDRTLTELAVDAGYAGVWQLCRAIKDDTGMTPTQYRRQFR